MKDIMAVIKGKLKEARKDAKMSQEEVAKRLDLSQGAYSDFERGESRLDVNYLVQLSDIFNKPVTWFLGIEDGHDLSSDEKELLDNYRSLSYRGKRYALGMIEGLVQQEKDSNQPS